MTTSVSLQIALLLAFAGILSAAGLSDLRRWLIPNRYCFAIAGLFPVYALAGGADLPGGLLAGAIVLGFGVVMFACGWMGGGDVKLLTAVGLWAGTGQLLPMILVVSLAGGAMCAVEWMASGAPRRLVGRYLPVVALTGPRREAPGVVPYGIAILAGGMYVAVSELLPLLHSVETFR